MAEKDPIAVELGRRGGLKGGPARAAKLTAKRRTAIAKAAADARWNKPISDEVVALLLDKARRFT